jgi:hypothetical protein
MIKTGVVMSLKNIHGEIAWKNYNLSTPGKYPLFKGNIRTPSLFRIKRKSKDF